MEQAALEVRVVAPILMLQTPADSPSCRCEVRWIMGYAMHLIQHVRPNRGALVIPRIVARRLAEEICPGAILALTIEHPSGERPRQLEILRVTRKLMRVEVALDHPGMTFDIRIPDGPILLPHPRALQQPGAATHPGKVTVEKTFPRRRDRGRLRRRVEGAETDHTKDRLIERVRRP